MIRLLRSLLLAFALVTCAAPVFAQALSGTNNPDGAWHLEWKVMYMRNTNAPTGTVVRNPNWAAFAPGLTGIGYLDSTVFRRAATTRTVYDTSAAYRTDEFPLPPGFGSTLGNAVVDTSSIPWIALKVHQDSLSYATVVNGTVTPPVMTTALDSIRVAAEYSYDGINWFSCTGTNTRRFDTVFMTSGADGLQSPTIFGVEASPGEDAAYITLSCHPSQFSSNAFILNRTLCMVGGYVRFIFGGAAIGQFAVDVGTWNR